MKALSALMPARDIPDEIPDEQAGPANPVIPPEDFRPVKRRNTSVYRKRMRALQRRANELKRRQKNYDEVEGERFRNDHELAALEWAIRICSDWIASDPVVDVIWTDHPFLEEAKGSPHELVEMLGTEVMYRRRRHELVGIEPAAPINKKHAAKVALRPLGKHEAQRSYASIDVEGCWVEIPSKSHSKDN